MTHTEKARKIYDACQRLAITRTGDPTEPIAAALADARREALEEAASEARTASCVWLDGTGMTGKSEIDASEATAILASYRILALKGETQ